MVSLLWAAISASLGLMIYLLIPFIAMLTPMPTRVTVGEFYLQQMARLFKQFTFVRRVLSGYDVLGIDVDAEKKLLKVTLSSSLVGSDKEYQFNDPDGRIKRLYNKPVAVAFELVPAAIDAELSEVGHYLREKETDEGVVDGDPSSGTDGVTVDPFVEVPDTMRWVDPLDAFSLVPNSVDPENITTAVQLTRKRYEKYGSRLGLAETMGTLMGFAAGIIGVAVLKYLNQNILDGGGGGGVGDVVSNVPLGMIQPAVDVVVIGL